MIAPVKPDWLLHVGATRHDGIGWIGTVLAENTHDEKPCLFVGPVRGRGDKVKIRPWKQSTGTWGSVRNEWVAALSHLDPDECDIDEHDIAAMRAATGPASPLGER